MACLDMYNNSDHKATFGSQMISSPRISFSNDFVQTQHQQQIIKHERSSSAPVSSDFEFSVTNYSMMSADELFFKGHLLPFKGTTMTTTNNNNCSSQLQKMTLRDELLVDEEDGDDVVFQRPPIKERWKGFLGLKRSHIGPKKTDKSDAFVAHDGFGKRSMNTMMMIQEESHVGKNSQEMLSDGGSSNKDVEMGI
ncbi:hypothetical protein RJ641_010265 [Dillenia turbinata]|uniref:Uncharacterized protein n=1 Tax=Dillenia turbinata TaxID=194707 RepID=A0AAN8UY54_9MAGN